MLIIATVKYNLESKKQGVVYSDTLYGVIDIRKSVSIREVLKKLRVVGKHAVDGNLTLFKDCVEPTVNKQIESDTIGDTFVNTLHSPLPLKSGENIIIQFKKYYCRTDNVYTNLEVKLERLSLPRL